MRATISFETDVDQVEGTMAVLAAAEEHSLRAAADVLSNYTVLDGSVLDAITEVLRLLDTSVGQLRQYRDMMVGFERARFETILPQPAASVPDGVVGDDIAGTMAEATQEAAETAQQMQQFNDFLSRIRDEAASRAEEVAREERDQNAPPKR